MKEIKATISIKSCHKEVILAFISPPKLVGWWQVEKTLIEPQSSGVYILFWTVTEYGMGYVFTGIIKTYRPESELVIENFVYLIPLIVFGSIFYGYSTSTNHHYHCK